MGWILTLGIAVVLFLQSFGTWLIEPMRLISQLGTESFFLIVMPSLLWCLDAAWGLRVGFSLMISTSINHAFKLLFLGPRPYWIDARVQPYSVETSFGAPSNHAQSAVAVWGMIAAWANTRRAWAGALLLAFLIGLSRLYLGMHFPHDVMLGWLLGALILFALLQGERLLTPWLKRSQPGALILAAFAGSLALILLSVLLVQASSGWQIPGTWLTLSARAAADGETGAPITPFALSGVISTAAAFFGLAAGGALLRARGWYDAQGKPQQLAARYLLGIAGLLTLYVGLDMIFPDGGDVIALAFRYLRYAIVGFWVAFLAPELFIRVGLAKRPSAQREALR